MVTEEEEVEQKESTVRDRVKPGYTSNYFHWSSTGTDTEDDKGIHKDDDWCPIESMEEDDSSEDDEESKKRTKDQNEIK